MSDASVSNAPAAKPTPHVKENAIISFQGVTKRFGKMVAVDNVNLDIREGEFFALLGPSGWVEDEKGTRGIHWVVTARFAAPVHYPYFGERPATAVGLTVTGAAPFKVVTE